VALQRRLASEVAEERLPENIKLVAGVDCSYSEKDKKILSGAVVFDSGSWKQITSATSVGDCSFPYVSGLLSFREAPAVIEVIEKLDFQPDLLLCDGQGRAHPRRLGLASHVGLWLQIPTIGVAKSCLCGDYRMPGKRKSCNTRLIHKGEVVGRVVRTRTGVKPVFVSPGHLVTLADSVRWTLRSARRYRLPEPSRAAHRLVSDIK